MVVGREHSSQFSVSSFDLSKNAAVLKYFKPRIAVVGRVDEWLDHTHFASYTFPWGQSYLTSGILYKRDKRFF